MTSTHNYRDLTDFLINHNANKMNAPTTHTRIGDKTSNIYGGNYHIPQEEKALFYKLYYEHVFDKRKAEYLTETQIENGPLLVDFDFRYDYDVNQRQHSKEHIQDIITLHLDELKEFFIFEENRPFYVYVMEKPHVNRVQEDNITKDGIHFYFGIQIDTTMQVMLREKMLKKIGDYIDLPIINTWDKVLDDGIAKRCVNWQLYGSRKPHNEAYELTQQFEIAYDKTDGEFMMREMSIKDFDIEHNLITLSSQNESNPKFEINPKILDEYNKNLGIVGVKSPKIRKTASKTKITLLVEDDEDAESSISLEEITNAEILKRAVDNIMKNLKTSEYYIKETHDYTQILPSKYYEPGSHLLNRTVAFALKHTDEKLFLSWIMLRSKASDFDYSTIPELYISWKNHFNRRTSNSEGVTRKTIMYWAKQDAYDEYIKVKNNTIDYFIEETLITTTEFDLATVLYNMFKDKYVCCSITNKTWYVFKNHKWETDQGQSLRLAISKEMHKIYQEKGEKCQNELQYLDPNDDKKDFIQKKIGKLAEVSVKLKRTNDKNNIMREAMELFYDGEFIKNMDANPYLMCFSNGVVDFKNKVFRQGNPQDYITKSTGVPYIPFDKTNEEQVEMKNDIEKFMSQLFPVETLKKYMWEHLASCLIGVNPNQTFNIYRGSGSNGKSKLTDLMGFALGGYKGTVPITLVTEKRNGIGGTSSEVIQLKGVRYAVMQEPSKDVKLNEGIMKELTGGDPIQARALWSESEIFIPQFKLVVGTNSLFEINSNDDGTWRRIRIVDFMSKFVSPGEQHNHDTQYIFPKDKTVEDKLKIWAPLFATLLVEKAFETEGIVNDCDIVLASSNKYRQNQDHIAAFVSEMIVKTDIATDRVGKTGLMEHFKLWFQNNQGMRKIPKGAELYEFMEKKFGKANSKGWSGIKFVEPEGEDMIDDE